MSNVQRLIETVETALASNVHCAPGLLAPRRVFTTPVGPSGGPELLSVVSIDDRWGATNWYGHVFRHPDTGRFIAGLFYSAKLLNGANEDILFKRLYHWTVIDPDAGGAVSQIDADCYAARSSFEEAVAGLCGMISAFDRKARISGISLEGYNNTPESRLLQAYDEWREGDETMQEYPMPPANPSTGPKVAKRQAVYPRLSVVPQHP